MVLSSIALASAHHVQSVFSFGHYGLSSPQWDAIMGLAAGAPAAFTHAVFNYNQRRLMKAAWRVGASKMSSKVALLSVSLDILNSQTTADHDTKQLASDVLDAISPLQLGKPQSFITDMTTGDFHQAPDVLNTVNDDLQAIKVCNKDQIDFELLHATMDRTLDKLLAHDLSPLQSVYLVCLEIIVKPLPPAPPAEGKRGVFLRYLHEEFCRGVQMIANIGCSTTTSTPSDDVF